MCIRDRNHIKEQGYEEIILHVAEWNQNAVKLYLKNGFRIKKRERGVRGNSIFSKFSFNDNGVINNNWSLRG